MGAPRAATTAPLAADAAPAIAARVAALRRARPALAARPRAAVVAALADVVEDWLQPGSAWMARAVAALPAATGFSAEMIAFALPAMLEPLRAAQLERLLADEAASRAGPALILHVLPGNLPGLAAIPAALSLAIGSAALLKAGRGDRVFPVLFLDALAARDGALAAAAAAVYWPGGERACEAVALAAADLVVAAGDDATIADLAGRRRGRFIGHGHRLSFALVAGDAVDDPASADNLAIDVATWDQRGCLSPQLCFVEGDFDAACAFGARLAAALERLALALPPAAMSLGERLDVRRWRERAEWARFGGERCQLFAAADEASGTVLVEPSAAFGPSPLARSLRVLPLARLEGLEALLAPWRGALEGAGLAAPAGLAAACARRLEASGVHLVSRLGEMQRPPLAWRQGGRPRLAEWCSGDGDAG